MNNNPVQFTATEISVEPQVSERGFLQDVMLGSINSTLHISNAQYPRDSGYFVCFGTNDDAMINYSNFSIFLQVIGDNLITNLFCLGIILLSVAEMGGGGEERIGHVLKIITVTYYNIP